MQNKIVLKSRIDFFDCVIEGTRLIGENDVFEKGNSVKRENDLIEKYNA